ncbi:MAG: Light-sensor Protein kinase [Caeruleum heppii]|nr:MAG: Light-sensor Protein kinase [Caeruleum heppii]
MDQQLPASPGSKPKSLRQDSDPGVGVVTARFKHVVTSEGHAVILGRGGNTIQRCEDEPIQTPGAVQGFGVLIALREEAEGRFVIRIASENSEKILGFSPKKLFALSNFCDILSEEQADNFLDHVDFVQDREMDPSSNGPEVFTISLRTPDRRTLKLWCAMHINQKHSDLIICEFELDDDHLHPLAPPGDVELEEPEDTLNSSPTANELAESTINTSRPLRVLRNARKRRGEAAAMEVFNIMAQVQEQLASASNLEVFLKTLVGVVKELTGFHRVMIYQFDASWNGRVVTELVDPRATKDLYRGLNFPASDIPRQARDLYKINKVRLLYDRDQQTARLVCRTLEDLETPLDLTHSNLRAMSPIHIKYLANMAVRASMSISINAFDELWGLIACHSYGTKGRRVSFPIRKMCRLVGDSASRNIERLSYASRLQARKLINTTVTEHNPSGFIIASSDDLLQLFDADSGLLSIRDETKILGKPDSLQESLAMAEYLRMRKMTSVISSSDLTADFPDLRYPMGFHAIAGLLFVPLSVTGMDFIVFFRKGQTREVKWAGNPYEKFIKEGTEGYLEPRKSFKIWSETIVGRCREWTEQQMETAAVLCLVYGKFIDVWRQKEAALQNSQLTRLLLANSAHEVRTPLNAIINYLEIALEGQLDSETRENLVKSHSASKSLVYVINDLLDLTKTEEGHELVRGEVFNLSVTIRDATSMFEGDAKRKGIAYEVAETPEIPHFVIGDQRRVRQAVSNLTANAIQHTKEGSVKVELWPCETLEDRTVIEIAVQDTGSGMSSEKLDALFRDLEQVQTEGDDLAHAGAESPSTQQLSPYGDAQEDGSLGLGLAVVARIVRNMGGQLRLKSEEGKGSRFVIQLPFGLPSGQASLQSRPTEPSLLPLGPTTPPPADGEVMLVDNALRSMEASPAMDRKNSVGSLTSLRSTRSEESARSTKSDVDRLIDAIQEPLMGGSKAQSRERTVRSMSQSSRGERPGSAYSARPGILSRSGSYGTSLAPASPERQRSPLPGQEAVQDSRTPITPVRIPETSSQSTPASPSSGLLQGLSVEQRLGPDLSRTLPASDHLNVLVAEDDPINSKIITKRLEKSGHKVQMTVNGEECASRFGEQATTFDVVLMDMQMPIVDGLTATKMIRSYEKSHVGDTRSPRASLNRRIPIFAVSASLVERNTQQYVDAGFDGWILKPIDFGRLNHLLAGIVDDEKRAKDVYQPGKWERGGWFTRRLADVFAARTQPSGESSTKASSDRVPAANVPNRTSKSG